MSKYNCKVIRIIDGDTIECEISLGFGITITKKVRFYEYDAPEIFKKNPKRKLGYEAKEFLEENILGKECDLVVLKQSGKYGRVIGDIIYKDRYITDVMKKEGYIK